VKAIIAVLVLILANSSLAFAQSKDASYNCVGEISGGLKYNDTLKQWEGVSFHPSDKFVLRMKFLRGDQFLGKPVSDYHVTITRSGRNDAEGCVRNDVNKTVYVNPNGVFQCSTGLGVWEYVFNVHTKRFLAFYTSGYVNGDKTGDTPSVEGGTCMQID